MKDWVYQTDDGHYRGEIRMVGRNIGIYKSIGRPREEDAEQTTRHVRQFLDVFLEPEEDFYALFDYSELIPPPIRNRKEVLSNLRQLFPRLKLVVFFGMKGPMRAIVRLAVAISGLSEKIFVCRDYESALRIVQVDMERRGIQNPWVPGNSKRIDQLLNLIGEIVWNRNYDVNIPRIDERDPFAELFSAVNVMRGDLQALSRENSKKQQRLEHANKIKEKFIDTMSHEVRTPLNGILGALQVIEHGGETEKQRYLSILKNSAEDLLSMVNGILDVTSLDRGRTSLTPELVDLADLAQRSADAARSRCLLKGLYLNLETDPELPKAVAADPMRLKQVFDNLLANAATYTAVGGIVFSLKVSKFGDSTARISFQVRDTGIGIPPDQQERIFRRFERVEEPETEKAPGSGLGLAISREIVRLMGGDILLESEEGKGSSFQFELDFPLLHSDQDEETDDTQKMRFSLKALAVDDNETNRIILAAMLKELGCSVILAASGEEALRLFQTEVFDILFLDCRMTGMDGLEAARRIRSQSDGAGDIPVIAVTAYASETRRTEILDAGMDGILEKPIKSRDLKNILRCFFEAGSPIPPRGGEQNTFDQISKISKALPAVIHRRAKEILTIDIPALNRACGEGSFGEAAELAHKLAGFSLDAGAVEAAESARKIEQVAKNARGRSFLVVLADRFAGDFSRWYHGSKYRP
ncbi:MAG: response regulator [Spirochaetales bacterium]|nr:response regulator [Spirochaetales bacterium]